MHSTTELEAAIVRLERQGDHTIASNELVVIEKALASKSAFMSAYSTLNLWKRLEVLKAKGQKAAKSGIDFNFSLKRDKEEHFPKGASNAETIVVGEREEIVSGLRDAVYGNKDVVSRHNITVMDCERSSMNLGVIKGSAVIENVKECSITLAAHQIRMRNCHQLQINAFSATNVVLEDSTEISVKSIDKEYAAGILPEMIKAGLMGDNQCTNILDFTEFR